MTIQKTKERMVSLLANKNNKVIAISGSWGSGKTHLWNEIRQESNDFKVKNSFYVSLFGLSSVDQIKRKLCESSIPGADSNAGTFAAFKKLLGVGAKALAQHYKALAALNDLNIVLMALVFLRGP